MLLPVDSDAPRRSKRLASTTQTQNTGPQDAELELCKAELEQCKVELDLRRTELRLKTLGKM